MSLKPLLKWILITSITLVSTTLLMFVSAYIAFFQQTGQFYNVTKQKVIFLSYTFNIFYLVITPLIFPFLKRYYSRIVKIAVVVMMIGCIGRYLAGKNYQFALVSSVIVGISHIPIITAPYGLLGLFQEKKRGYASSIPLFVPALGINYVILYGMNNVVDETVIDDIPTRQHNIEWLNFFIALTSIISTVLTIILMNILSREISTLNEESEDAKNIKSCLNIKSIKNQFKEFKEFIVTAICWGAILGINWSYGGMFGVFLGETGLSHKEIALIGLYANISSALFSNLGNWISNRFHFSNTNIIFYLNILGFLASLFIQASTALPYEFLHDKLALIVSVILLRAGFSSFVSLSLIQLSYFGSSVLVSSIFFYVANALNLISAYVVTLTSNPISLGLMSFGVWICVFIVCLIRGGDKSTSGKNVEMIEISGSQGGRQMQKLSGAEEEADFKNKEEPEQREVHD